MKMPKATPWVIGTAFVSILILVLAWMVGVGPQMESAQQARDDAERVEMQNVAHQRRLNELREQFQHLDEYKAEIAEIAVQLPPEDGEPAFIREIAAAAASAGVFVVSVINDAPEPFLAGAPAEPAPAAEESEDSEGEETEGEDAAEEAPTGTPQVTGIEGFVAVPFSITVLGTYDATVRFVELAQQFQRLFVVTGLTIEGQRPSAPSGGKPEVYEGDAQVVVNGYVYVLQDTEQPASVPEGEDDAATEGGTVDT